MLIGITVALTIYTMPTFFDLKVNYTPPAPAGLPDSHNPKSVEPPMHEISEYNVIAEENLFHKGRKMPDRGKEIETPDLRLKFVLYGTVIADDISIAYMEDKISPCSTPEEAIGRLSLGKAML
jgi:hypothetical protein